MKKNIIPVVFSTNNDYTLFCYTAIFSLITHSNPENIYKVYVLVTDVTDSNRVLLESLSTDNVFVSCVNISEYLDGIELQGSMHLSIETYYRLFIPIIFTEYDRIIYLDSDLCVYSDIAKLYELCIDEYAIAAAIDVPSENMIGHYADIKNVDYKKAFNAGVLIINCKEFERQQIRKKCLEVLAEDFKMSPRRLVFADQDALNIVLKDNYKLIDSKWNYQPQYLSRIESVCDYYRDEYISNSTSYCIVHYAGVDKPWYNTQLPKADMFWNMAGQTKILFQLLNKVFLEFGNSSRMLKCFDMYRFPYGKVKPESNIVLYAAGNVGKSFFDQLNKTKYARCILWVDRNCNRVYEGMEIKSISEINNVAFDYVVIALDNEQMAKSVREDLIRCGVKDEKIVWENYCIKV